MNLFKLAGFCFFLCFTSSALLFSQVLKAKVFNEDLEIIPFADIYVNGKFVVEASNFGNFYLNFKENDTIRIFQPGYIHKPFVLKQGIEDTLNIDFVLSYKVQEINEVDIKANGASKIFGSRNQHIIDYYPLLNNDFYILKSYQKEYYLSYERENELIKEVKLSFKPEELYRDFLGNIHVLSKDSSYQIFYDEQIYLMKPYAKSVFENQLKFVVANGKNGLYMNTFRVHNQRYFLQYKSKEKDIETLLYIRDSIAERVAQTEYQTLIGLYHFSVPEIDNIILNGTWDGNVNKLMNKATKAQLIWYSKVRSLPMNIASFDNSTEVVTVDFNANEIYHIDKENQEVSKKIFTKDFREKPYLVYDYVAQQFYFYLEVDGETIFYHLNEGSYEKRIRIDNFSFPKKIKIVDGWVYFLAPQNDFNKVFKIQI